MPRKLSCIVTDIVDHGEHVYSVFLKPETRPARFLAGQFLHLALDPYTHGDFWPDSRPFSIASPPSERELLRITYSVKGRFTQRMESALQPGLRLWIKLPYGEFIVAAGTGVCLLAGGTGVSAFTAFLSDLDPDHPSPVYLLYGARRADLLIYRRLAASAAARCPNLHPYYFAEQDANEGCVPGPIDLDLVWKLAADAANLTYYLSGPPGMLTTLSAELEKRSVATGRIRIDAWE